MKFKRTLKALALGSALTLGLSACATNGGASSSGESNDSGSTELTMLVPTYSDATKGLWEKVIKGFEAANKGVKVSLEVVSWDDLDKTVATRIQGGKAPDIYNGGDFTSFVSEELLYPISEVTSPETLDDFTDSFIENASVDGVQYGAPLIASARALFANQDLLDKAGITEWPKTWDDLKAAALKIKETTGKSGYGLPLGSEEAQAEAAIWFYGAGGGYGDASKLTIDSAKNIEAAQYIKGLYDAGATQPDPQASQRTPLLDVFVQGEIGFQIGLPPTVKQIKETNPDLNYTVGSIPTKDGSPFTLGVADHLVAFNTGGEEKKEAIKAFFDYFYSTDVYTDWVTTENFLPTTDSGNEKMSSNEDIKAFLELLPDANFYPSANPHWQDAAVSMKQNFGLVITQDPADVLKKIQSEADAG
ncbi:ABC transporter substrate-binding protein [Canibacter zhoujuaniae]|uniref:ABC transporter substrate-binding protein n=1 Tax=Canibacter zhoujuaniae TaxID=2708343 RepID=UPI001422EA26|nr:extracellular solute-binding protein [Canibacter zhoujuaniae]